jgi:ABC-type uncharacterized transport system substrate-binding protein
MEKVFRHHVCWILFASCVVFSVGGMSSVGQGMKKVLIVHSYDQDYLWTSSIDEGIDSEFDGLDLIIERFYMDTKRYTSAEWFEEASSLAHQKYEEFQPDLVIVSDDNAQELFAKSYAGKEGAPPFVVCGVNSDPEKYGYPADNVTGVLERYMFVQTLELLLEIKSDVTSLAILTDNSESTNGHIEYMKSLQSPIPDTTYIMVDSFNDWRNFVFDLPNVADVVAITSYSTLSQHGSSENMNPLDVVDWTITFNTVPTITFSEYSLTSGLAFCGVIQFGSDQGEAAASIAKQILFEGKTCSEIPLQALEEASRAVNLAAAKRFGIDVPDSVVASADLVIPEHSSSPLWEIY